MKNLFEGVIDFSNIEYNKYSKLFKDMANKQSPHTLFIGCSDSRVVPTLITKTLPGELFVVRNIANIVPPDRNVNEYLATTSAIEFAVNVLNVKNIVVCGHSNCGGCKALYMKEEDLINIPHTKKWLELAEGAKKAVLDMGINGGKINGNTGNRANTDNSKNMNNSNKKIDEKGIIDEKVRGLLTERENVKEQIKHLHSYPYIQSKLASSEIKIYGWHYIIETGEVYNYSFEKNIFEKIDEKTAEEAAV